MNPEPEPCSTCGRRRNWGKKSSKPGGRRWLSARSTCCDLMNTTAGFTCSAMDTKASLRSATAFGTTTGVRGALPWAPSSDGVGESGRRPERSEEHTSELQSRLHLVCRLLLEKKKQL